MMAVPLHAGDAERRLHRKIVDQRNRTKVREVFFAEHADRAGGSSLREEARVRDALEDAFAILMASTRVAKFQRPAHAVDFAIAFIDDDRRAIRPRMTE